MNEISRMTTVELLSAMTDPSFPDPLSLVKEAQLRKSKLEPLFLDFIQELSSDPASYADRKIDVSNFHISVVYLLAQWKSSKAYPSLLSLVHHDFETTYDIFGDHLISGLPSIIASLYNGEKHNLMLLVDVINDASLDYLVRVSALNSLYILYSELLLSQESLVSVLSECMALAITRQDEIINDLVNQASFHRLVELRPLAALAFESKLMNQNDYPFETINANFNATAEEDVDDKLVDDAIDELSSWSNYCSKSVEAFKEMEEICMQQAANGDTQSFTSEDDLEALFEEELFQEIIEELSDPSIEVIDAEFHAINDNETLPAPDFEQTLIVNNQ